MPLPAWEPGVGWEEESVPFDAMPHRVNPPEGFWATANSAPHEGDGPYLGSDWLEPYRKQRIVERLAAKRDWTVEENCRLQLDVQSLPWPRSSPSCWLWSPPILTQSSRSSSYKHGTETSTPIRRQPPFLRRFSLRWPAVC